MKLIDVSCAIILRDGKILAAQRNTKGALPLKWEFPGGKVEAGETLEESLIREIREELGMEIRILKALSPVLHHYPDLSVKLWPFVCSSEEGEPVLKEHNSVRWLEKEELQELDWAEADIPIVKELLNPNFGRTGKYYFRFREHPGDMFRGTLIQEFPDPENNFEDFLVQFLPCYQRDDQVAYLDDLYKLLYDEYEFEEGKNKFIKYCGLTEEEDIKREIDEVRERLRLQAYENFYDLVQKNKIEIFEECKTPYKR